MANIPTLNELYSAIVADIESKYSTTLPAFGKNFLRALASVQAGKLYLYYLLSAKIQKNIFADTADSELFGGTLERFGRVKLGRNPFPATAGQYTIEVVGTVGAFIPANTTFKANDDSTSPGSLYVLDTDFTLTGTPPELIQLRSLDAGLDFRLEIGNELTLTAPIALVDDIGTVTAEIVAPQSAEETEDYRRKVLDAYRLEPQGGSGSDYRIWASDVQSVEQSYPYASTLSNNEVDLFIEATIADSTDGFGTPSATTLTEVQTAIESPTVERPSRKPLGVHAVNYLPVIIKQIDIEITGFVGITPALEAIILTSIETDLETVRPFVGSIDIVANKNDIFDTNKIISLILETAPGSVFGAIVLKVDSVPVSMFQFLNGDIPHLNSISYV